MGSTISAEKRRLTSISLKYTFFQPGWLHNYQQSICLSTCLSTNPSAYSATSSIYPSIIILLIHLPEHSDLQSTLHTYIYILSFKIIIPPSPPCVSCLSPSHGLCFALKFMASLSFSYSLIVVIYVPKYKLLSTYDNIWDFRADHLTSALPRQRRFFHSLHSLVACSSFVVLGLHEFFLFHVNTSIGVLFRSFLGSHADGTLWVSSFSNIFRRHNLPADFLFLWFLQSLCFSSRTISEP